MKDASILTVSITVLETQQPRNTYKGLEDKSVLGCTGWPLPW